MAPRPGVPGLFLTFALTAWGCGGAPASDASPERAEHAVPVDTSIIHHVAWSPDGRRVIASWDRGQGSRLVGLFPGSPDDPPEPGYGLPVTFTPGDRHATWSPDGQWVVFQRRAGDGWQLVRVRPDGMGEEPLTDVSTDGRHPAFSPAGRRLAFISSGTEPGDAPRLHVMEASGEDVRPVPLRREGAHGHPAWDPTGSRLVVEVASLAGPELWLVDPSTGGAGRLDAGSGPVAWSPDGERIYYAVGDSIFARAPAGRDRMLVESEGRLPALAPDGRRLAFVRGNPPSTALYVLDLDSGERVRITP